MKENNRAKANGEQQIISKDSSSHSENNIFSAQDIANGLDNLDETTSYGELAYLNSSPTPKLADQTIDPDKKSSFILLNNHDGSP